MIPVEKSFAAWRKDPKYVEAYNTLEDEFAATAMGRCGFRSSRRRPGDGCDSKSLIRMFGPSGNPQARNLFSVVSYLQKQAGLKLHVTTGPL